MATRIRRASEQQAIVSPGSVLSLLFLLLVSSSALSPPLSAEPNTAIPPGEDFGAGLSLENLVDLSDVVAHPERYADEPVLVRGRIAEVCQRRGCWTVLSEGDTTLRVRFKDYAFFLPKDCSGKQAYVEGVVKLETLSEKMARHYASESRDGDPSAIHGPQRVVGFTASGVRLIGTK